MRFLITACLALALAVTGGRAQEESCAGALQARAKAGEALVAALPRLDAECNRLREQLEAFAAAEAVLRRSHALVRRSCPAGDFVRADADVSGRSQFILEAARRRMAKCTRSGSD